MKTKMNLRWRWLLGLSLMLCWLGGSGPNAVQAQESGRTAADKMMAPAEAPATTPGKVVASMPTADLPTVKVAQYRRGRKSAQPDTVRFTVVWAANPDQAYPMEMMLAGEGEGVIDWGDGTQSSCSAAKTEDGTDYSFAYYEHYYTEEAENDEYEVTVYTSSPDLQITGLNLYSYTNYDVYTLHSGVDVRSCPSLKHLSCGNNWLGALDLTRNTALEKVYITRCRLTSLTLPESAALNMLACGGNQLTSLDVSGCPGLTQLYCWDNQLTSLDVSACPVLDTMQCSGNQLGWATLDALSKLDYSLLSISPQKLPSLDVNVNEAVDLSEYASYNGQQTVFSLGENTPSSAYTVEDGGILKINTPGSFTVSMTNSAVTLKNEPVFINRDLVAWSGVSDTLRWVWTVEDVSEPAKVSYFFAMCDSSFIIDWGDGQKDTGSMNMGLYYSGWLANSYAEPGEYTVTIYGLKHFMPENFQLGNSHIKALDVRACPGLTTLQCSGNQLTELDLSNNAALMGVYVDGNQLTSLDFSACPSLEIVYCGSNQLTELNVTKSTALRYLSCSGNPLTELDVTKNTALKTLGCYGNQLTSLDVSACLLLENLNCDNNELTELDVTKNTALENLSCSNNELTELDVTKNTALKTLSCYGNHLTSLDLSACLLLDELNCSDNELAELDLSNNTVLTRLDCDDNQLTSLDVSQNLNLDFFSCIGNRLTTLNTGPHTAFANFYCTYNQLGWATLDALSQLEGNIQISPQVLPSKEVKVNEAVDLSEYATYNDNETEFEIMPESGYTLNNGILSFQLAGSYMVNMSNPGVTLDDESVSIGCAITVTPGASDTLRWVWEVVDLEDQNELTYLYGMCDASFIIDWGDGQKQEMEMSEWGSVEHVKHTYAALGDYTVKVYGLKHFAPSNFQLGYNHIKALDVRDCPSLTTLQCSGNQLTELDLSNNPALGGLYVDWNQLTSLDVSACPWLELLYCGSNELTELDVTKNTALWYLSCGGNQLTELDVTKNTALKTLSCYGNQLTSLDVSACLLLEDLSCFSNELTELDVTKNTALQALDCAYNQLTSLDLSQNTALTGTMNCSNNQLISLDLPQDANLLEVYCQDNKLSFNEIAEVWEAVKTVASIYQFSPQTLSYKVKKQSPLVELPTINGKRANVNVFRGSEVCGFEDLENCDALLSEGEDYEIRDGWVYVNEVGTYTLQVWHGDVSEARRVTEGITQLAYISTATVEVYEAYDLASCTFINIEGDVIQFSFAGSEGGSFVVDWGDGKVETVTGTGDDLLFAHTLNNVGQTEWLVYGTTPESHILLLNKDYGTFKDGHLDVSACPELTYLVWRGCDDCENGLTALNVGPLANLDILECENQRLTSLDASACTALRTLRCANNQLTSLTVPQGEVLEQLWCQNNRLSSLDVSGCEGLVILKCNDNELTDLDVTQNTSLSGLYCGNNRLTELDVTNNTALSELYCGNNLLTSLDVSENASLYDLFLDNNQVTALTLPQGVSLHSLSCGGNRLPFTALANISATQKFLSPQSLSDSIDVQDGITLPMLNYSPVNVEVLRGDELLAEDEDYTVRLDSIFYKLYFAKAGDYRLIQWHDALLENYEHNGNIATRVYHDTTEVTVTGKLPDTVTPGPGPEDGYDLAVWTWFREGNGVLETNVAFTGTEGGSFVIDWGDGERETVEGTGERVKYTHIYDMAAQEVGPTDTVFGLGRTGQVEWQLYATTPESHILELVKISEVGLSNETLDVSGCPELTFLVWVGCEDCGGGLTALDVSHNLKLENLYCYYNQLTELDVTKNTALTLLSCHYNQLTSLDVTQNTALASLYCTENRLTSLDVTKNTALTLLSCSYNQLTSLDVTKNTALTSLACHENQLTSLVVTQNTALTSLSCSYNPLMSLDLTKNAKLESLWCYDNRLTALDVTQNTALTLLSCGGNQLTSLDVTKNTALEYLYCYENQLTVLDMAQNTALLELFCGNNLLTSLDLTQNVMLESLNCYGDRLTSLDVTKNTALTFLNCRYNQLTSLDLTQNLMLETLYCGDNELTSLEVSQNTALALLSCGHNQLTSLDVSDCMALEALICNHNQLTALNLPQDAKLETLACDSNAMPLSVLATFKDVEAACLSPQQIACETQPGKVLDLRSEMRIGATQTVYTVLKDGKPVDSSAYTMNADGVYGQLRFKTPGQYRLSLSNAEVTETCTVFDSGYYNLNETPQPVYVYYDITVEQPIVQGSGAGWMWLALAGAEKQVTFEGSEKGFRIDWGDDATSDIESGVATHRYAEGGIYTVKIESLSKEGRLTSLDVSNGNVAMIWFEDASQLTSLNCADNQLTSVDLSTLSNLQNYNCARNQFSSLDLTSLAQLQTVDFSGNQLTAVSLPTHSNLKAVKGTDNRIKLSTLYGLLSQRVEKASYGFDPQCDSVYVTAGNVLDLSAEMNIGGNTTTYVVSDAEGRPVQASDYTETNGSFRFTEAGHRYKLTLMNMSVMEYQNGNPQKPVTFVLNVIVPGVGNEELTGSDACVYVRNRTICLSEDLGEMRVYTTLGRCIYKGNGLEAEVPCAGLYVVQAGGHTWKVVVR